MFDNRNSNYQQMQVSVAPIIVTLLCHRLNIVFVQTYLSLLQVYVLAFVKSHSNSGLQGMTEKVVLAPVIKHNLLLILS